MARFRYPGLPHVYQADYKFCLFLNMFTQFLALTYVRSAQPESCSFWSPKAVYLGGMHVWGVTVHGSTGQPIWDADRKLSLMTVTLTPGEGPWVMLMPWFPHLSHRDIVPLMSTTQGFWDDWMSHWVETHFGNRMFCWGKVYARLYKTGPGE
jgi:hypothetical protein